MEVKNTKKILDDFTMIWSNTQLDKNNFLEKADYIDNEKYKLWVSVNDILYWIDVEIKYFEPNTRAYRSLENFRKMLTLNSSLDKSESFNKD